MEKTKSCEEVIRERKSVRSFSSKEVSDADIMSILDSARLAPSAKNRQPWKYVLLSGEEKEKVLEVFKKKLDSGINEPSGYASLEIMRQASKVVLVFLESEKILADGISLTPYYLSVGASIENALLRATELGISSLWVYDLIIAHKELKQMYFSGGEFMSALLFGYEDKKLPRAKKKSLDEIVIKK